MTPPQGKMQTMGVFGGLGPQATIEFESLVHSAAQRLIPQRANAGYPPMLVLYFRSWLAQMDAEGHPLLPLRPNPLLIEAAAQLGRSSDFIVIVSNGVHRFADDIARAAGKPVLNLIDLVLAEVERRGWRKVGALTYFDAGLYADPLRARGLECEAVDRSLQAPLDEAIGAIMEGRAGPDHRLAAERALAVLRGRAVDGTILGCTEIPMLLPGERGSGDILDPIPLLAEAAVRRAIG